MADSRFLPKQWLKKHAEDYSPKIQNMSSSSGNDAYPDNADEDFVSFHPYICNEDNFKRNA